MNEIDISKINWDSGTNWGFWGTVKNINAAWLRELKAKDVVATKLTLAEFGYAAPDPTLAYAVGDVVKYHCPGSKYDGELAVIVARYANPHLRIKFANDVTTDVTGEEVKIRLSPSGIPPELIALARAEAGSPVDMSKCPLKQPCCRGGEHAQEK